MTKLTKEQVKFFIETMTDDMHNTTQHEIAETLLSKFDECESLQTRLLAYEQAAKNEVALPEALKYAEIYGRAFICVDRSGSVHAVNPSQITLTILNEPEHGLCAALMNIPRPAQPVSEPYKLSDGRKLVPFDPAKEMFCFVRDWSIKGVGNDQATGCNQAMLATAPAQESE